jgi:hypothetical protein
MCGCGIWRDSSGCVAVEYGGMTVDVWLWNTEGWQRMCGCGWQKIVILKIFGERLMKFRRQIISVGLTK